MVAIEEELLFCCKNNSQLLQGQHWAIYRAKLARGLLWMCKIGKSSFVVVDSVERLCGSGI